MIENNESAETSKSAPQTNSVKLPIMKSIPPGVAQIYRAFGKNPPAQFPGSIRTTIDIDRQDIGDFYSDDKPEG